MPESLLLFFAAALLLALSPGPDLLFVIAQAAAHGWRAGCLVAWGLCSGLIGHTSLVALGVGQWLARSPTAMAALRYAGAAYLLHLSYQAGKACIRLRSSKPGQAISLTGWSLFRRGIVMNLFNPKVSLFFVAFLPQFVEPARGDTTLQIVILGSVFATAGLLVFHMAAFFAAKLGRGTSGTIKRQRIVHGLCAALFSGLALRLAIQ